MANLTQEQFQKAINFIKQTARPLDVAHYNYEFENGEVDAVLKELATYQNEDGGFGHGIEADFRLKASSPMATSVGLQYCIALDVHENHAIVQNAARYLVSSYNKTDEYWPFTYENVNDEPHARWWHVKEIAPPTEEQWANVSAELVGYVARYATLFPKEFVTQVTNRAKQNLATTDIISPLYSVLCWERASLHFEPPFKLKVQDKLKQTFTSMSPISQETLQEIDVIAIAPTPDSIFAIQFPDNVNTLLDIQITQQAADGGWWPSWKWGQFEEVWPIAQKEWAGKITLGSLLTLRDFGKIEE